MLLIAFRALIQFTTILPLGKPADFSCFARYSWLYPVSGYIIGAIAAAGIFWMKDPLIAASGAVAILLFLTGANHFDGLLDFGDGLMAHGSREKRQQALTDYRIGTGGVAMGISVILITFTALAAQETIWTALIVAEVAAKFSMVLLTTCGAPFREGLHSLMYQKAKSWFPVPAFLLCLPLLLLPVAPCRLAGAGLIMFMVPAILLITAKRLFGGVNGDIVGASNELTRAFVLAGLVLIPGCTLF